MLKKARRILLAVAIGMAALTAGVGVGTVAATALASSTTPSDAESVNAVDAFPTNKFGQTYGYVDQGLTSDAAARAELVFVTTDGGKDGWAYSADLLPGAFAKTFEDAVRESKTEPFEVSVYELDGRTLIGSTTVNRPPER